MNVILFGATGMVGQGALRECLLDPGVERVLTIGRRATGQQHEKLHELVLTDLHDYSEVKPKLAGYDACFFCLGVASAGMSEADYRQVTRDIPAAAGRAILEQNPGLTFIIVTGAGSDSSGKSSTMWARVKGEAENAIFELPFRGKYAFRPSIIRPLHGITSRTPAYRLFYTAFGWLLPALAPLFPGAISTTERIGRALLNVARRGYPERILDSRAINQAALPTAT